MQVMAPSHPEDGQEADCCSGIQYKHWSATQSPRLEAGKATKDGKLGWTGLTQVHLGEAPPTGDDLEVLQLEGLREDGGSAA